MPSQKFFVGRPEPQMPVDPCEVLGVSADCTAADLRRAWRKAVLATHPDHNDAEDPEAAAAAFREVQQAFTTLSRQLDGRATKCVQRGARDVKTNCARTAHTPTQPATTTVPSSEPSKEAARAEVFYTARTRWHLNYHSDKDCHGLRNVKHVFEEGTRPFGLEACPYCVPHKRR